MTIPASTRAAPTTSTTTVVTAGKASWMASYSVNFRATDTSSSRSRSEAVRNRDTSSASRPRAFTVRAPSTDSWATPLVSPRRRWTSSKAENIVHAP